MRDNDDNQTARRTPEDTHAESGCTDYLQHPWESCPENTASAPETPTFPSHARIERHELRTRGQDTEHGYIKACGMAVDYDTTLTRTIPAENPTTQFGMSNDGHPTLIIGDHRSTQEKLTCAQVQIESDKQTIANLEAHADALAEALRKFTEAYRLQSDHDLECAEAIARQALAAYEREVR